MSFLEILDIIFKVLGTLVSVGMFLDKIIPDEYDKGFMKKLSKIPFVGQGLRALQCFSPLNNKFKKK